MVDMLELLGRVAELDRRGAQFLLELRSSRWIEIFGKALRQGRAYLLGLARRRFPLGERRSLPGRGEQLLRLAALRLIVTEALQLCRIELRILGDQLRIRLGDGELRLSLWVVRSWDGVARNLQPHEHDELRWVGTADLPGLRLAHQAYVDVVRQAVAGAGRAAGLT